VTILEVIICRDAAELARRAAEQLAARAAESIARTGRFAVALSGGSTPRTVYSLLAAPEFRDRIDWPRVHLFWGDERCVSPVHPDSNFRMVQEALLSKIAIPAENIHRMMGENEPAAAAAAYEQDLKKLFGANQGDWPRFDLIFLGLGEDGHTASLFPGSAALSEDKRWVAVAYVERLRAHRLTLTFPVINAAKQITFLVSGASKRAIVKQLLGAGAEAADFPAAKVRPVDGKHTWLITQDAAGGGSI
jgi:6-phosphogluconolactonase